MFPYLCGKWAGIFFCHKKRTITDSCSECVSSGHGLRLWVGYSVSNDNSFSASLVSVAAACSVSSHFNGESGTDKWVLRVNLDWRYPDQISDMFCNAVLRWFMRYNADCFCHRKSFDISLCARKTASKYILYSSEHGYFVQHHLAPSNHCHSPFQYEKNSSIQWISDV